MTTPPRYQVAYVLSRFPSLSETFILREIVALRRRGIGVLVFSLRTPNDAVMHDEARSLSSDTIYPGSAAGLMAAIGRERGWIGLLRNALREAGGAGPTELAKTAYTMVVAASFAGTARRLGVRHLHAHWTTYPALAARTMAALTGLSYSVTTHAFDIFLPNPHRTKNLRAASQVVTISEFNRRYLQAQGFDRDIVVIPCGLDLTHFAPSPGAERSGIVAVGRLDPIKGFMVLIDACALLARRGIDVKCDIIGEGPQRPILTARIAEHGLADRIRLLGALEQQEVRSRVSRARVFTLPCVRLPNGDQDGIPVSLMEAMALQIPVVTTPVSGIPELVTDGVSGLLTTPQDPVSLADALLRVLTDDTLAQTIAAGGRRVVERHHDIDATSMTLARLLGLHEDGLERGTASLAGPVSVLPEVGA